MKKRLLVSGVLAFCMLLVVQAIAGKRDASWKEVDEAIQKGLPKTAVERLEPIIKGAIAEKKYAEAIKAISKKIALEGVIQGNKPEEKITRMKAEIAKAPEEMVPMMDAVLGTWYWHYFQQNRWRFMQRTATGAPPSEDFTTWSLPRIFAEIDKQFTKALSNKKRLQATAISEYDDLLERGTLPDSYRPTLYDFLANEAIEFYASGEQAAAKAEDAFELTAGGSIFGPAKEFMGWEVKTTDTDSPTLKAIRLYQELLRFHEDDADKSAFLDADLARLAFGFNKAFGEEKNARYKAALKGFVDRWGDHEISAVARYRWAEVLRQEGELVEARALALQGAEAFPNSPGGKLCYNLVKQIEAKSYNVTTERVWCEPWPAIEVRYRNLEKIHFRAVPFDYIGRLKSRRSQPEQVQHDERKALLAKKPAKEWSAALPATEDYQERTEELPVPKDLEPGFYFLIASHDPKFGDSDNQVQFSAVWVSKLAMVMRTRWGETRLEGFVLEADSGNPVAKADVQLWIHNNNSIAPGPKVETDANGLFTLRAPSQRSCTIHVSHGEQELSSSNPYYAYQSDRRSKPYERTIFFTDRSLYRPGQTIQYKGLTIAVDQEADDYEVVAGEPVTVVFQDTNGKEIARQQHRTNDYGSFNGSFTAPRDRLMGRMTIRVDGKASGATSVSVEEYKRPKFQVALESPEEPARLNGDVKLQGKATAYTGAAIDGAKVRWRVVRQVRYPHWWYWCYWWRSPRTGSQEIAHGTAATDNGGAFPVEFTARPDLSVLEKDEPIFQFTIYADVTDTAGETRSAQRVVNVGYTALQASMSTTEWLTDEKPVEVFVSTQSLDGEGRQAEGSLKVYRLKQPEKVHRPSLSGRRPMPRLRSGKAADEAPEPDPANPNSWELGEMVAEEGFTTDASGSGSYRCELKAGAYRVMLETQDRFGKKVTARLPLQVLDPDGSRLPIKIPEVVAGPRWSLEPGEEFMALWGTGYEQARAFMEIEHRGRLLAAFWTEKGATQQAIKQKVSEKMRGGFTLRVTMVRENRAYLDVRRVDVPWSNKNLSVRWEHFVSKLQPGQKETWTAVITGPDAKKATAEMVAALYDQSLDAYLPHSWQSSFGVFRSDYSNLQSRFENMGVSLRHILGNWVVDSKPVPMTYRELPADVKANLWGYGYFHGRRARYAATGAPEMELQAGEQLRKSNREAMNGVPADKAKSADRDGVAEKKQAGGQGGERADEQTAGGPNLDQVAARKNLNETAFFFPHLISDKDGVVKLEFTMPEALTQWKFLGFAHDGDLRSGFLQDSAVTAKDLMVQPNPPRFLREGDVLEFTVKVSNQSPTRQEGTVRLTFADARTGKAIDDVLGNATKDLAFDIPSKESRSYSWRLAVPDGLGPVSYKAVGATSRLSDGEEAFVPVLSRRILVTESLPLPVRGPETKKFEFTKLLESGKSDTLVHQNLTVEMVSNPAWYAVMALPYLMEYPYECSEQVFNRLYANALARHIANSDPKIRRIFDQWKGTPALDSPLEKNQDLKAVMLEETPWFRQAKNESEARRNVGILFDENRLNSETGRTLRKLAEMQLSDGAWPWFPGGRANDYITLYITTGFGRMRHLGVDIDVAPAVKSLTRLDGWIDGIYREILRHNNKDEYHLSPTIALYLYGRSFFLDDKPVDPKHREAVDYFLGQARKYWLQLANRQSQAHLAVALKRFGDKQTPGDIMRSIKERSVSDEELGMFWRDTELSWWWYRAPIETQAMMIEAFDEVMNDRKAVEDCKVWLLKQKQTQDWKTTKATADAVYGLLLRGENLLASDQLVEVSLGAMKIEPKQVEAGTGYYQQRFGRGEIEPEMGRVTVKKVDEGVAWGAVHWQYLEDMAKVTPYEGTPLKLAKSIYTKQHTKKGPVLEPVKGPVAVGDELVVRVVLRTDRDMEYVHMKDYRASGTEPVNVLSRYKYQDGLAYYESTRDTASHFFIDYLPKGTYVFEYSTRVVHKGQYQTGVCSIQCMYAPEFNSHSESIPLVVE